MISVDLSDHAVLVTGGTRGLGRVIGEAFAQTGAQVYLTHRWGSVDEAELCRDFVAAGLRAPVVVEADASDPEHTRALLQEVRAGGLPLHTIVSNVAFAKITPELSDLKRRSLELSLGYTAWPVVDLVQTARDVLGRYPRYVVGIGSDAQRWCHEGYDLVGASKAVLETLCRYLASRLTDQGVRVNVVCPGLVDSEALQATFGPDLVARLREHDAMVDPVDVARTCVALCSGWMDGVSGQVLAVDEGWGNTSPLTLLRRIDSTLEAR